MENDVDTSWPDGDVVVDARQVCARLGISRATLDRQVKAGKLPAPGKVGGQLRWSRVVVDEWIRANLMKGA